MHLIGADVDLLSMQCMGKSFALVFATPFSRLDVNVQQDDQAFSRLNAATLPAFLVAPFSRLNAGDLLAVPSFSRLNAFLASLPFSRLNGPLKHPLGKRYRSPWPGSFSRLNGPRSQTPKENAPVTLGRFLLWLLNQQERL